MLNELVKRYPILNEEKEVIKKTAETIIECYKNGGKLLICGNGGSCADAEHIVGELMKGFLEKRPLSENKKAEMKKLSPEIPESIKTTKELSSEIEEKLVAAIKEVKEQQ